MKPGPTSTWSALSPSFHDLSGSLPTSPGSSAAGQGCSLPLRSLQPVSSAVVHPRTPQVHRSRSGRVRACASSIPYAARSAASGNQRPPLPPTIPATPPGLPDSLIFRPPFHGTCRAWLHAVSTVTTTRHRSPRSWDHAPPGIPHDPFPKAGGIVPSRRTLLSRAWLFSLLKAVSGDRVRIPRSYPLRGRRVLQAYLLLQQHSNMVRTRGEKGEGPQQTLKNTGFPGQGVSTTSREMILSPVSSGRRRPRGTTWLI